MRFIDCGQGNEDERFQGYSSWGTWTEDSNATDCFVGTGGTFNYGIYNQAVALTTESNLITRYVYSLFWGFQVLSMISSYSILVQVVLVFSCYMGV